MIKNSQSTRKPQQPASAPSYTQRQEWLRYQPFLPAAWRLEGDRIPTERWWSYQGMQVHLDELRAPEAQGTVIILHGGGGCGRVVMCMAPMVREMGYDVVAPDLPGYGLTKAPSSSPTYDLWADLTAALVETIARPGHPVYVFGLSLGGLLAYGVAARSEHVAGVIATTLADTREPDVLDAVSSLPAAGWFGSKVLRHLPRWLQNLRLPIRWLCPMHLITNDPDLSAVFVQDPLAGGSLVSLGFLRSLVTFDVGLEPESFTRCPVLCAHPAQDPWTPARLSRRFFDRIAGPKQWIDLEGAGHLPYEQPGATQLQHAIKTFLHKRTSSSDTLSEI